MLSGIGPFHKARRVSVLAPNFLRSSYAFYSIMKRAPGQAPILAIDKPAMLVY